MAATNWAGNYEYRARRVHRPATVEQVQDIVAAARRVRVLGSRHSFNAIADSDEFIELDGLTRDIVVDRSAGTVHCSPGVRYGELAEALAVEGLALHNLASLPHISVAGAVATATHGSGDANGNLATAVAGLDLVTSTGELLRVERGAADFEGVVVGLGALGAVTRVTLDVEPAYDVRQWVFEGLGWDALCADFDAVMASGDSVSIFTSWGTEAQVWVKSRVGDSLDAERADLFGARRATEERHPIVGIDPVHCTPQLGVPGAWSDRLPHFRMAFTPSSGDELQSEFFVSRQRAVPALAAVREQAGTLGPLLQVSEIRTIAADGLWMSPQYRRDAVGIHFTWRPDQAAVQRALALVESALAPFDARPHWAKLFVTDAAMIGPLYPRLADFARLVDRLDPRRAFRNAWLERHVLGGPSLDDSP